MKKIGSLIGPVIKVDKVTLAQARGKFCRICVEVNLDEPLRPFVEVNRQAYGIVYEGISTICFNCGVYGHVKDQCPYTSEDSVQTNEMNDQGTRDPSTCISPDTHKQIPTDNDPPSHTDEPGCSTKSKEAPHADETGSDSLKVRSEDMGPWMVMNYKNKNRANSSNSGGKGKAAHGSRFAPLQVSEEDIIETPIKGATEIMTEKTSEPKIVHFWKQVQKKTLKTNSGASKSLNKNTTMDTTHPTNLGNNGNMVKSTPLTDISNASLSLKNTRNAVKSKVVARPRSNEDSSTSAAQDHPSPYATNVSYGTVNPLFVPNVSFAAAFGHSPPEEACGTSNTDNMEVSTTFQTNDEHSPRVDENAAVVSNKSSPFEEEMTES